MKTPENRRFSVPRKFYKFSWVILLTLILLLFIVSCTDISQKETRTLTELEIEACNMADEAGSCDTRLVDLGIILKEDCCQILGKCC